MYLIIRMLGYCAVLLFVAYALLHSLNIETNYLRKNTISLDDSEQKLNYARKIISDEIENRCGKTPLATTMRGDPVNFFVKHAVNEEIFKADIIRYAKNFAQNIPCED